MHHALKDVTLELNDKGMVFVLGKSGSGKSTLLNLIGGLDKISSGKIDVDGNVISSYSEHQLVDYRNSCIGFIFQDHHLIDDLTVFQNVKLALELKRINNDDLVRSSLEQVGLSGYGDRYPRELSGGERQRVAIARAIVKRPRIILADEPTGNLDGKNAAEVMRILKTLSKECLVLTVSHNTSEVRANADRIIELSDGNIISDMTRNNNYNESVSLENTTLSVPGDRPMTETDVAFINENLEHSKIKSFRVSANKFETTVDRRFPARTLPIEKKRLTLGRVFTLSFTFLKTKVARIFSVAIPLSLILLIIMLSQAYINFDGNRIIADRMERAGETSFVLSKVISLDGINKNARRYPGTVTPEDYEAFLSTGFTDPLYPILSVSVPVTTHMNSAGVRTTAFSYGVAANESLGTIVVKEEFLKEKLGYLEYMARVRTPEPLGVYITDYLADMILSTNGLYKGKTYVDLVGFYSPNESNVGSIFINGIIKTDYKTRYAELIDRVTVKKETDIATLYNDEQFQKLTSELYSFLAYSFSFNENYLTETQTSEAAQLRSYAWSHKLFFNSKTEYTIPNGTVTYNEQSALSSTQAVMGYKMYNAIFGTDYNPDTLKSFTPHTTSLAQFSYYDTENKTPLFETTVEIVGLSAGDGMEVSADLLAFFNKNHVRETGIYFDGVTHLSDILAIAESRDFIQDSVTLEGILTLNRCVRLFILIFRLVNVALCAAVVFIFISFSTKMIRDKLHDIGILKALGTNSAAINTIFGLQIGLIAVFTCLSAVLGYYFLIEPANNLFIISLREMVPSQLVLDLNVLVFLPKVVWETVALIAVLAIVSLLFPMSGISRIQPVKIINTRE